MAEISYSILTTGRENEGVGLVKWAGLALNDTGKPFIFPRHTDRTVSCKGTYGVGGTCVIEGDLEIPPTSYAAVNDPQGNPIIFTVYKNKAILENATNIRPRVSAGDGTTSLDVYLLMSK